MLDIATEQEDLHRIYVINLRGRIDSITARDFEEFFEDMLKTGNRFFVLDASRLEFVSSSGIAALVKFIRRLDAVGGATAVIRMNPEIRMLLEFFGLEDGLPEYERLEDAREYLSARMREGKHSLAIEKEQVMHPLPSEEERRQSERLRQREDQQKQDRFNKSREAYARPLYSDEDNPPAEEEEPADDYEDDYDDMEGGANEAPAPGPRVLKLHRPGEPAPRQSHRPREREETGRPAPRGYDRAEEYEREAYAPDPERSPARPAPHPKKYYVQGELDVQELRSRVEQIRSTGAARRQRPLPEDDRMRDEAIREYRPLREKEGRNWTHAGSPRKSPRAKAASKPRPQLYYREAGFDQRAKEGPKGLGAHSLQPPEIHLKAEERQRQPLRRQSRMRQAEVIHRERQAEDQDRELVEFAEPRVLVCESCGSHLRVYHSGRHMCANPECRVEFRVSEDGSVSYFEKL